VPATNSNNETWYILRYAHDFVATPTPAPYQHPVLDAQLFYDDERHVLELAPVAPTADAEPPPGLAVSPDGEVYRVDAERGLVLARACDGSERSVTCERGVFLAPAGLALDRRGILYIADPQAQRVVLVTPADGQVVGVIAGSGLREPVDVAVAADGRIYVADRRGGSIRVYGPRLQAEGSFVPRNAQGLPLAPKPIAVALDAAGAVVVADARHPRLLRFGPRGESLPDRVLHAEGAIEGGRPALDALVALYGTKAPISIAGVCGACAPDDDLGKRLAAVHLALRLLLLRLASSFETAGSYVSAALDGAVPGVQWHKLEIDADLPEGTWIKVQTATSDFADDLADPDVLIAPAMFLPPEDLSSADAKPNMPWSTPDRLVFSPPGRWLRLRLVLGGDGKSTPSIRSIRIFYPRVSYLDLLPAMFRRDPEANAFLEHFLALFEHMFTRVEDRYEQFSRDINPDAAPLDVITWLAALVDLSFDPSWPLEKRRALVASAAELYKLRGTPEGVRRYVEIYTGVRPEIIEDFLLRPARPPHLGAGGAVLGCNASLSAPDPGLQPRELTAYAHFSQLSAHAPSDPLDAAYAHRFEVIFYVPFRCDEQVVIPVVDRIVTVNKPAHTVHRLRVVRPDTARVGSVQVGLDLLLGGGERAQPGLPGCATPEAARGTRLAWGSVASTPLIMRTPDARARPLDGVLGVNATLTSDVPAVGRPLLED
jgi:phage tail-like protein